MGATALRGILGRAVIVSSLRGEVQALDGDAHLVATVHPSSLLRSIDAGDRDAKFRDFVADLSLCAGYLDAA